MAYYLLFSLCWELGLGYYSNSCLELFFEIGSICLGDKEEGLTVAVEEELEFRSDAWFEVDIVLMDEVELRIEAAVKALASIPCRQR